MAAREDILQRIQDILTSMTNPAPGKVSRDFFDFEKLAITQFPAILMVPLNEDRQDISMSERQGNLSLSLRCFVRGEKIDTLRNDLLRNIEETIETERALNVTPSNTATHLVNAQVQNIQVIERQPPIGELIVGVDIAYVYKRGNV
jgi:hypothetical protein